VVGTIDAATACVLTSSRTQLCPDCAELNFVKRHQKADMTGMVCLVTGGRVKIGTRRGCVCKRVEQSHA